MFPYLRGRRGPRIGANAFQRTASRSVFVLAGERRRPSFDPADSPLRWDASRRYGVSLQTHRILGAAGACARWSEHRPSERHDLYVTDHSFDGSQIGGAALGAGVGYDWQFDRLFSARGRLFLGRRSRQRLVLSRCSAPRLRRWRNLARHRCAVKLGYEIGNIGVPLLAYVTGGFAFGGIRAGTACSAVPARRRRWLDARRRPRGARRVELVGQARISLYRPGNRGIVHAVPPNMERLRMTLNVIRVG